jgi:hypothetical protein
MLRRNEYTGPRPQIFGRLRILVPEEKIVPCEVSSVERRPLTSPSAPHPPSPPQSHGDVRQETTEQEGATEQRQPIKPLPRPTNRASARCAPYTPSPPAAPTSPATTTDFCRQKRVWRQKSVQATRLDLEPLHRRVEGRIVFRLRHRSSRPSDLCIDFWL